MRDRLFIRIERDFPEQLSWLRVSDDAERRWSLSRGALSDAGREAGGCQLIVLVPGAEVLLTEVLVPSRQRQHIINAVPFALEDQLAADIDELHFALGPRNEAGMVPVAVVAQQTMQNWLGHLRDAGLEPDIMVPDVLALPLPENDWTLLHDGGDVLVRQGIYAGAAIDTPAAADWFDLALAEQGDTPPRLRLFDCQYGHEDGLTLHNMDTVDALAQPDLPLQWLAQHFSSTHSINLIQGDYSPREQIGRLLRPWRPAAALLLVLALLGAARMVTDVVSLSGTSERLAAAINQVYLDTFPDARKVVDARVQMERKLAELGSGSARAGRGFLSLLALSSKPLQEIDSVELQHASYQDGRLSLALRINSLQLLEQLKQALLRDKLLNVEIQSAASRGSAVDVHLQLWRQDS